MSYPAHGLVIWVGVITNKRYVPFIKRHFWTLLGNPVGTDITDSYCIVTSYCVLTPCYAFAQILFGIEFWSDIYFSFNFMRVCFLARIMGKNVKYINLQFIHKKKKKFKNISS